MLAVWCFTVFAAVGERLAVSGKGESESGGLRTGSTLSTLFCISILSSLHLLMCKLAVGCDFIEVESR